MTTRLRDEAVLALQEVRERSAGVRKDLAAASDELEDIRQKITARSAELATITKRLVTAGLRESQAKQKAETKNARPVAPPAPLVTTIVAPTPEKKPSPATHATDATGSVSPSTATSPPATVIERRSSPIAQASPRDAPPPNSALKPSAEPSPAPVRKPRELVDTSGSRAVIGPGDLSSPSNFELRSDRVSKAP
jgi:hypothetical protein